MAGVNRGDLGGSRSGLRSWLLQRVSAIYMAAFTIYLAALLLWPATDYAAWRSLLSGGVMRLAMALFFLSLLVHAWIGLRSVYLDYLKPAWLRFVGSLVTAAGLLALLLWAVEIALWDMRATLAKVAVEVFSLGMLRP